MAKNRTILSGTINRVFEHAGSNGRTFYSVTVAVPDPARNREDGTPFTYNINVNVSGPLAERIAPKLAQGMKVCVEGTFEPTQKEGGKRFYTVNANDFAFMDAGIMNQITIYGRLTRDPELRHTQSGTGVTSASVAVDRNYRDKNGEWQAVTSFIDVTAWAGLSEALEKFRKGNAIWVTGRLTSRKYTDKEGVDRYPVEITADTVLSGGTGKYNATADGTAAPAKDPGPAPADGNGYDSGAYDGFSGFDGFDGFDEELPFS